MRVGVKETNEGVFWRGRGREREGERKKKEGRRMRRRAGLCSVTRITPRHLVPRALSSPPPQHNLHIDLQARHPTPPPERTRQTDSERASLCFAV
jgi:hypothetical protein